MQQNKTLPGRMRNQKGGVTAEGGLCIKIGRGKH